MRGQSTDVKNAESSRNQVPLFAEIKATVNDFGPAHQYILQYMLKHGQVSPKRFYLTYIHYYVTMILDRADSVVSKIVADQSQLQELTSAIIQRCNKKAKKIGIQLVQARRETDGAEFVSVLTQKGFSPGIANRYGASHDEKVFLSRVISHCMQSNGTISKETMREVVRGIPNLNNAKYEKLMAKLIGQQWILENDDYFSMEPRAISELSPLLRDKYQTPTCVFCQNLVVDRVRAGMCANCEIYAHSFCIEKLSKDGKLDCPLSCGSQIELTKGPYDLVASTSTKDQRNSKRNENHSTDSDQETFRPRKKPMNQEQEDAEMMDVSAQSSN